MTIFLYTLLYLHIEYSKKQLPEEQPAQDPKLKDSSPVPEVSDITGPYCMYTCMDSKLQKCAQLNF